VDLITVSTLALASHYAQYNHCAVLPNYLDRAHWGEQLPPTSRPYTTIGWLGAFHWRGGDLELLKPWIAHWLDEHPECRFISAGAGPELGEYLRVNTIVHAQNPKAWRDPLNMYTRLYDDVPRMLRDIDIGLAPLVDNPFNRAKSWCKAMEYGAAGIPAVVSPLPEYRRYIRAGVNGYFVRKNDWRTALDKALANLPELRVGARQVAEEHFIDDFVGDWETAYESAAKPGSVLLQPKLVITPKAV
jgi:glycosyltransferase involved in cell wall biosynthesis